MAIRRTRSGNFGRELTFTLSVTAGTYTAGTLLGHKLTLSNPAIELGGSGIIQGVTIYNQGGESPDLDIILFNENPASTTFTDQAALDVDDNDLDKVSGLISVTSWSAFSDNSVGQERSANFKFQMPASQNTLYIGIITRSALSTAATTDFSGKIDILLD